jgi:hypothetical protein
MTHLGSLLSFWVLTAFENVAALRLPHSEELVAPKPAVALMLVGKVMDSTGNQSRFVKGETFDIFSVLTGANVDEVESESPSVTEGDAWANIQANLIKPMKETYGYDVDIFLCVDKVVGQVPDGVKVSTFYAQNQQQRANHCARNFIKDNSTYEWVIKARADFLYYRPIPDLREFSGDYIYSRFRHSTNIAHLTSDHVSFRPCTAGGIPKVRDLFYDMGYVNDDAIFVVPKALVPNVFYGVAKDRQVAPKALVHSESEFQDPGRKMPEEVWSKYLCDRGVMSMPLAVAGYPRHDCAGCKHQLYSQDCAKAPINKNCGRDAKDISKLHQMMKERYSQGLDMC